VEKGSRILEPVAGKLKPSTLIIASASIVWLKYALPPIVGLFIGWLTNYLAIRLLFRPRKPLDFKLFVLHGIFPKNKSKLADRLGNVVQRDLISYDDIRNKLEDPTSMHEMAEQVSVHVETMIRERLHKTKFQQVVIPEGLIQRIHEMVTSDIEKTLPKLIDNYVDKLEEKVDIYAMVQKKVNNFSDEKLEDLILAITKKEFKFIELIGAVLGFIIGSLQVLLNYGLGHI
jgi:uncharacterized membrane protein YheB (UPF0754 family)